MFLKLGIMNFSKPLISPILEFVCLMKNMPTFPTLFCFSQHLAKFRICRTEFFWLAFGIQIFVCVWSLQSVALCLMHTPTHLDHISSCGCSLCWPGERRACERGRTLAKKSSGWNSAWTHTPFDSCPLEPSRRPGSAKARPQSPWPPLEITQGATMPMPRLDQACPCHLGHKRTPSPCLSPHHPSHSTHHPQTTHASRHGSCAVPELVDAEPPCQIYLKRKNATLRHCSPCQAPWAPFAPRNTPDMVAWCFACRYAGGRCFAAADPRRAAACCASPPGLQLRHRIAKQPRIAPAPLPRNPTSPRWATHRRHQLFDAGSEERERSVHGGGREQRSRRSAHRRSPLNAGVRARALAGWQAVAGLPRCTPGPLSSGVKTFLFILINPVKLHPSF